LTVVTGRSKEEINAKSQKNPDRCRRGVYPQIAKASIHVSHREKIPPSKMGTEYGGINKERGENSSKTRWKKLGTLNSPKGGKTLLK